MTEYSPEISVKYNTRAIPIPNYTGRQSAVLKGLMVTILREVIPSMYKKPFYSAIINKRIRL